jgi:hydroxymethylpyrimidine pyrophosphatase-like HAD family hydrolase
MTAPGIAPGASAGSAPGVEPWLVALDVDGTLLDYSERLAPAVADAVTATLAAGHHVVLATGRSVTATVPVARELGIERGWAVCSNGSLTIRLDPDLPGGYEVATSITFDPGPALRLLHTQLPDALFAVEEVGVGFRVNRLFPPGELHGEHTVVGLDNLASAHVTRLVVRSPEHTPEEFHELAARLGLADVSYAIGWSAWMDVAPAGVTKAAALEPLREALGVGDRTLAAGDGNNDVEMLRWATRGVAMGHAPDTAKAAADEVAASITEDGLAPVLRSLPGVG